MTQARYEEITYGFTLAAARSLVKRTPSYRILYAIVAPLFPLLERLAPRHLLTTETLGRAMLAAAKHGAPARPGVPQTMLKRQGGKELANAVSLRRASRPPGAAAAPSTLESRRTRSRSETPGKEVPMDPRFPLTNL